jgi:hypothetical protein
MFAIAHVGSAVYGQWGMFPPSFCAPQAVKTQSTQASCAGQYFRRSTTKVLTGDSVELRSMSLMQLLIILTLAGTLFGLAGGAYTGGMDAMILGSVSGLVLGVLSWMVSGSVLRALREYRLDQYFQRDSTEQD